MYNFFKKILSANEGAHTVVIINDDGSKPSTSHRINPYSLWLMFFGIAAGVACVIVLLILFTPVRGLIYNEQDVRNSVITIQQKVAALQDTLEARNSQLRQIQSVIVSGSDTSFTSRTSSGVQSQSPNEPETRVATQPNDSDTTQSANPNLIPRDPVVIANLFKRSPQFPASYPVEGSPTRLFNRELEHYGLDIAAEEGTAFQSVADGVILSQEWTINYGYVIVVQHSDGVTTIYKHASGVDKKIGESVRKGDILGTIGDVGVVSSGPHLHIEIWERGIPQNPQNYLIN